MESIIKLDWIVENSDKLAENDIREKLGDKVTSIKLINEQYDEYEITYAEYEITYADTPKKLLRKLVDIGYYNEDEANDYLSDIKIQKL